MISNQSDALSVDFCSARSTVLLAAVLQVSVCCAVSFMSGSSARFWVAQSGSSFFGPVSDAEIVASYLFARGWPCQTTTDWGIRVWNEWAASRATAKDKYTCSYCFVVHTLFMHLYCLKKCIICLLHT